MVILALMKLLHQFPLGVMPTMENWLGVRVDLLRRWKAVLGTPSFGSFDRKQEPVGGANSQPIRQAVYGA